jgi:hypothetical protein
MGAGQLAALAGTGVVAGLASGLLGVGGGVCVCVGWGIRVRVPLVAGMRQPPAVLS